IVISSGSESDEPNFTVIAYFGTRVPVGSGFVGALLGGAWLPPLAEPLSGVDVGVAVGVASAFFFLDFGSGAGSNGSFSWPSTRLRPVAVLSASATIGVPSLLFVLDCATVAAGATVGSLASL